MKLFTSLSVGGGAKRLLNSKTLSPKTSNSRFKHFFAFSIFLLPVFAFGAGGTGLAKVDNFLSQVNTWLIGGGTVICAIAFAVAGYKVMFGSQSVREVAPIIIGGVLIGGGSAIAGILM